MSADSIYIRGGGNTMNENTLKKIKEIIEREDITQPLSDEEISQKISVLRETVTNVRNELNIPNSRERKKNSILEIIHSLKKKNNDMNSKQISMEFAKLGFEVSVPYINKALDNYEVDLKLQRQQPVQLPQDKKADIFSNLVGYDRSLKNCIKQAKASVRYPPFGLATLIIGESGTGKTLFVEYMHKYAIQENIIAEDAAFMSLNCADYADNPQLLLSILYGYKKGAFTGADTDTEGLVEKADNNILFLDEIHRLPPKGQEILFSLLDKGTFRRLGETSGERKARIFFIGATTENIESTLLTSFRRRIPMIISMPSLKNRSASEKVQLIYEFFQVEANRINSKIFLNKKIIKSFILKDYQGNIGQIKSEIQVTCANAYIDKINSGKNEIDIGLNEILYNNFFSEDASVDTYDMSELNRIIKDKLLIPQNNTDAMVVDHNVMKETKYSLPEDIYQKIEKKYQKLKNLDLSPDEIEKIMWTFIMKNFNMMDFDANIKNEIACLDNLKYVVKDSIIDILKEFVIELKVKYPQCAINGNIILYLAIHINEAIKRIRFKVEIINPNSLYIRKNMKEEYELACQLALKIENRERIQIPEDEISFIAMYIKKLLEVKQKKNKIGIIIMCHGKIATEMLKVVNELMNIHFPIAIDMPLAVNPSKIFEKTIEIAKILNTGKGILFLVDMGSLVNVGDVINKRTGIKTRTIDRIDILTVLEAVRKVYIEEKDLDDIYYELVNLKYKFQMVPDNKSQKPPAVVAMCLTGQGMAENIKAVLSDRYSYLKIFTLGLVEEDLKKKIDCLKLKYNIVAIVGTINPGIEGIKFISFEKDFINSNKIFLDYILKPNSLMKIRSIVREDSILLDFDLTTKQQILERMCALAFNNGYIKKEYLESVVEREKMNTTYFKGEIAIPHGMSAYVNNSCIIFLRLKNAVEWDSEGRKVKLICMLAIGEHDVNIVTELFRILKQEKKVAELIGAKTPMEFINVFDQNESLG